MFLIGYAFSTQIPIARADTFTFGILPSSGNIAGQVGTTIGWGYVITNPSSSGDWLVTDTLNADLFANGTPNSLFDFPILAPGTTLSVSYDPLTDAGLYKLSWDPTAPDGFVN